MKKFCLWISIGVLLFSALLAGCNRPIPITPSASKGTPLPSIDALLLTRTVLAQQIEDTLTAIAATAGTSIQQTADAPIVKTRVMEQVTVGVIDTTPLPSYVVTLSSEGVTVEATLASPNETTPGPNGPTTAEISLTGTAPAREATPEATAFEPNMTPIMITPAPVTPMATPGPQITAERPTPQVSILAGLPTSRPPVLQEAPAQIPEVYILQRGEFPWCLARRFNIHPQQIMWLNGFVPGQTFFAGQAICLPQNPLPFPGQRALHPHPAFYTVGYGETVYSIACFFGDVDPLQLAAMNAIAPPNRLKPGQVLTIP